MDSQTDLQKLNQQLFEFFAKYRGITNAVLFILIGLTCIGLIMYFFDIHWAFKEIAQNPAEWCWNNYPIRFDLG